MTEACDDVSDTNIITNGVLLSRPRSIVTHSSISRVVLHCHSCLQCALFTLSPNYFKFCFEDKIVTLEMQEIWLQHVNIT
jgi:hypothetical protein